VSGELKWGCVLGNLFNLSELQLHLENGNDYCALGRET
jgi:hypothetical protein